MARTPPGGRQSHTPAEPTLVPVPASTAERRRLVLPTGFPSLDRALTGGVRTGELLVLGGDVGSGASALALAIALRVARTAVPPPREGGHGLADAPSPPRVLLLTGEMTPEATLERALAIEARVPLDALRLDFLDDEQRHRIRAAAARLRQHAPVIRWLGAGGVAEAAHAVAQAPKAALVVVDGLEALVEAPRDRDDALAAAVRALKRLAVEAGRAILLLSHLPALDRARPDRRPRLADFGALGAVGVQADVVLGLFREELYDADLGVAGAAELRLLKRRDGPTGYVDLYYDAPALRFEDMLDPGEPPASP
jgi:replicative DNA helicase